MKATYDGPGCLEVLVAFTLGIILAFVSAPLYGAVLAKGWEWFVADTFGIYAISTVQAIGLSWVVGLITHTPTDEKLKEGELVSKVVTRWFQSVFVSAFAFLSFLVLVQFV